jgi:transcriptional regulator with XRE-family HTH domain
MTAPPHEAQQPPPEADLIRIARLARGLSPERAAELTRIQLGGSRWRQIERGYKTKGTPVQAPAKTLAHMAHVVGAPPEQLAEVGRGDAAEILREILRQEAEAEQESVYADLSDRYERAIWEMALSEDDRRTLIDLLRKGRQQDERVRRRLA